MRGWKPIILFLLIVNVISPITYIYPTSRTAYNVSTTSIASQNLLYNRTHFGVVWEFYDSYVRIHDPATNDDMLISFWFTRYLSKNDSLIFKYGRNIVSYSYIVSASYSLNGKTYSVEANITNVFLFSDTVPQVKLKTIVELNNTSVPEWVTLQYKYHVAYVENQQIVQILSLNKGYNNLVSGKRIYFDYHDMNISNIKYATATSVNPVNNQDILDLTVNITGNLVIDPVIGYTSGNITFNYFYPTNGPNALLYGINRTSSNTTVWSLTTRHSFINTLKIDTPIHVEKIRFYRGTSTASGNVTLRIIDNETGKVLVEAHNSSQTYWAYFDNLNVTLMPGTYTFNYTDDASTVYIAMADNTTYNIIGLLKGNVSVINAYPSLLDTTTGIYYNIFVMEWNGTYYTIEKTTGTYNVTSSLNTTYTVPITPKNTTTMLIYQKYLNIINITRNDGTLVSGFKIAVYNETYNYVNFTTSATYTYTVHLSGGNVITNITYNKYAPRNTTQTITGQLLTPYNEPLANKTINYTYTTILIPGLTEMKTILTQTIHLACGTVIAPHLYAFMIKASGNISTSVSATYYNGPFTYVSDFYLNGVPNTTMQIVYVTGALRLQYEPKYSFRLADDRGDYAIYKTSFLPVNTWVRLTAVFNGTINTSLNNISVKMYAYNTLMTYYTSVGAWTPSPLSTSLFIYNIQNSNVTLQARYLIAYNRTLTQEEIGSIAQHVLNAKNLQLLFDPTFYNGTVFLDLLNNSIIGIPHNIERIEDDTKWLWVVENATSDNLIHFKYFPVGSWLVFRDVGSGRVVGVVRVESGDFVVNLPEGKYVVSLLEPVSYIVSDSVPSLDEALYVEPNSTVTYNSTTGEVTAEYNTSNDNLVWLKGFPVGTKITFIETWSKQPIWTLTITDNQPTPIYLPPGNYRIKTSKTQVNQSIIAKTTYLAEGTIIAPHLYVFYANQTDNISDFISISTVNITLPIYVEWKYMLSKDPSIDWYNAWYIVYYMYNETGLEIARGGVHGWGNKVEVSEYNSTNVRIGVSLPVLDARYVWRKVIGYYSNGTLKIWYEGTTASISTDVRDTNVRTIKIYVGGCYATVCGYHWGKLQYMRIYDADNNNKTILLLDATFYNGTHYFDLINDVVGTPYGNVQRVPANQKWLWVIENATSDGLVHFKWFPIGSVVEVWRLDGVLVRRFIVDSSDVAFSLPDAVYRVVVYLPYSHSSGSITSDSNGVFKLNVSLPVNDSVTWFAFSYSGNYYAGYYAGRLFGTGINFTLVPPKRMVKKNDVLYYGVWSWLPVGGRASEIYVNGTKYPGYVGLNTSFTLSGWYNLTLVVNGSVSGLAGKATLWYPVFVGGAIVWNMSRKPATPYFKRGETVNYTVDAYYQNGVHVDPNATAYIYVNGSLAYNGSLPHTLSFTLYGNTLIEVNLTDIDGETYYVNDTLYINYLYGELNYSGYLSNLTLSSKVWSKEGIIGKLDWMIFILQNETNKTYVFDTNLNGSNGTMLVDRVVVDDNYDSYFLVRVKIINAKASTRSFNISVKLEDTFNNVYVFEEKVVNNVVAYGIFEVTLNLTRNIVYDIPYYLNVTVVASDNETASTVFVAPLSLSGLKVRYIIDLDTGEKGLYIDDTTYTVVYNGSVTKSLSGLNIANVINTSIPVYARLLAENDLGVGIDPETPVQEEINLLLNPTATPTPTTTTTTVGITTTFNPGDPFYKPEFPPLAFPIDNSLGGMLGVMFVVAMVVASSRLEIQFPRALLLAGSILTIIGFILGNLGLMGVGVASIAIAIGLLFI